MRRFLFLLLAVAMARPAFAATSVSVEQMEQRLIKLKGKSDAAAANELSGLELTERATSTRLARWETEFRGERSRDALMALVDASAFLKLPAADVYSASPPDQAAQDQIMARAIANLKTVFSLLPNFYATRGTTHFEDALPRIQNQSLSSMSSGRGGSRVVDNYSNFATIEPIHRTGKFDAIVSYRDGDEVTESPKGKALEVATGLTTSGEFGPILEVVVGDARRGKVVWDHWEQGPTGTLAVFRYEVPEPESHFMVRLPNGSNIDTQHPGYHGEMAIDPESGDIFRVTEVAQMQPPQDRVQAALLVEYAPVAIGEHNYICPVRGVAIIKMPTSADPALQRANAQALQTYLNDEAFTQYHLFRGDTRIVSEDSARQN